MAQTKKKTKVQVTRRQSGDGAYLLKMVMYLIVGCQWLWFQPSSGQQVPLPIGLLIGLLFAMHEHFQIDRKIEYAVLLVATLAGFVAQIGVFITL
jgi:hypothetical protein